MAQQTQTPSASQCVPTESAGGRMDVTAINMFACLWSLFTVARNYI